MATISSLLADHVSLQVRSVDRLFLQGYVPRLMTEMPMNFLKYYVTRRHFTGGFLGLRYAAIPRADQSGRG